MNAIMIGLDIDKSVFQVHGEDSEVQKRLRHQQVEAFFANVVPSSCRPDRGRQ